MESVKCCWTTEKEVSRDECELMCESFSSDKTAAAESQIKVQNDQRPAGLFSLCPSAVEFGA